MKNRWRMNQKTIKIPSKNYQLGAAQPSIPAKFLQYSIRIPSKFLQKSIKILSKMEQKSIKNRSKSRFGRLQGRFGGVLGRLGRSKASLEASWSVLEASWRPLGRAWAEKGGQHGSNLALKTELKSIKNWSQNWSIFKCLLESIFGRILMDFGCQNGD